MNRTSIHRMMLGLAMLLGLPLINAARVDSAEPNYQPHYQPVDQSYGILDRMGMHNLSAWIDAPFHREPCEPGDIPLAPWDRAPRSGSICERCYAHHQEKKAWHYYIRGVGPAVHQRSPGRPCIW